MTNADRIRNDSPLHFHDHQALQPIDQTSSLPVLCAPAVPGGPVEGSLRVSQAQGKCKPKETSRKRSEPSLEEIAEVLQVFRLEQKDHDVDQRTNESDVVATTERTFSELGPAVVATPSNLLPQQPALTSTSITLDSLSQPQQKPNTRRHLSPTRPQSLSSQPKSSRSPRPQPSTSDPHTLFNRSVRHLRAASSVNLTSSDLSTPTSFMSRPVSLLIASLGNPPPYHSTRHSAAHLILKSLQQSLSLPPFTSKSRPYGGGHISIGADVARPEFTLYQSAVQMNVSGPPLLKAWKQFSQLSNGTGRVAGLVVLHDEMEIEPAKLKVRRGDGSAKGHNGIKSVQQSLQGAGLLDGLGNRFVKVGIGIGRPAGGTRDSKDVSAYVLGQLTSREKEGLERCAQELEGVLYQEMARIGQGA